MIFSLYVGDLKENITPGQLYDKFSTIGQISAIHVCRSRTTGRSLQYGYVNYEKKEDGKIFHVVIHVDTSLLHINTTISDRLKLGLCL